MVQATAILLLCNWFSGPIFVCVAYSSQTSPCSHSWIVQQFCARPVMVWLRPPTYGMFMGWICGFCWVLRGRARQTTHPGGKGTNLTKLNIKFGTLEAYEFPFCLIRVKLLAPSLKIRRHEFPPESIFFFTNLTLMCLIYTVYSLIWSFSMFDNTFLFWKERRWCKYMS